MGNKPPSKLHCQWRGPLRVVNNIGSKYVLQDLITKKLEDVHVSLLKQFHYDSAYTDPEQVALTDKQMFVIEQIEAHKGDPKKRSTLPFKVKWAGESEATWAPWSVFQSVTNLKE
jgi:hypothetical protein